MPPLRVPWTIDIIFHFILAVIFSTFNFHMYLENSVLLTYLLVRKSLVWILKQSLNEVSAILKYFLSGLLGADTTVLYTMFVVKHLLLSGHLALFLQLHPWLLEFGWILLRLREAMMTNTSFDDKYFFLDLIIFRIIHLKYWSNFH